MSRKVEGAHVKAVNQWRRPSDHFDWLMLYLNTRGIRLTWRAMIAVMIVAIAVVPTAVLFSPNLPHYPAARAVAPVATGFGVLVAIMWLIRWPTRGQSVLYSLGGSVCVAAACLVQGDPLAGLLGCCTFALLGGYIAFFHTALDMMVNFAMAMATAAVLAQRLGRDNDAVLAGSAFLLVLTFNVAFPSAVRWLIYALGSDLRRSSRDTLTGLLIRRVFYQSAYALLLRRREGPSYLGVAMIDLDNFKRLNDTLGHSTGDKALVEVAGALRLVCPPTSIIARFGGEEFVVADTYRTDDLYDIAEQWRTAIAAISYPITASIGIASAPLRASFDPAERRLVDDLVNLADTAMYAAKHAGGNQSRPVHIPHVDLEGSPA
jgi:diguanylate cyclase (GGDEF)-like protein